MTKKVMTDLKTNRFHTTRIWNCKVEFRHKQQFKNWLENKKHLTTTLISWHVPWKINHNNKITCLKQREWQIIFILHSTGWAAGAGAGDGTFQQVPIYQKKSILTNSTTW